MGRAAAEKAGLANRIAIEVRSYDSPPQGPFDLAIAIESLAQAEAIFSDYLGRPATRTAELAA